MAVADTNSKPEKPGRGTEGWPRHDCDLSSLHSFITARPVWGEGGVVGVSASLSRGDAKNNKLTKGSGS